MKNAEKRACLPVKRGFTLVELVVIVAILGILATVVLVNMNSAKTRSSDKAVFAQITSTQATAFKCMKSGVVNAIIDSPTVAPAGTMCSSGGAAVAGFPDWPSILNSTGWQYASGFAYCSLSVSGIVWPTYCNSGFGTTCGYNATTGEFCYRLAYSAANPNKVVACNEDRCWWCITDAAGADTCSNSP